MTYQRKSFFGDTTAAEELSKTPSKRRKVKRSKTKPAKQKKSKSRQAAPLDQAIEVETKITTPTTTESAKLYFDDEKVAKMFYYLTPANRAKVNDMITELFFAQL